MVKGLCYKNIYVQIIEALYFCLVKSVFNMSSNFSFASINCFTLIEHYLLKV